MLSFDPVWAPDSKRVAFNYILREHNSDGSGVIFLPLTRRLTNCPQTS
jgi:hypothetical protein